MSQKRQQPTQKADDIQSLSYCLGLSDFDYQDILSQEAWQKSLKKWPLLQEWDLWSKKEGG